MTKSRIQLRRMSMNRRLMGARQVVDYYESGRAAGRRGAPIWANTGVGGDAELWRKGYAEGRREQEVIGEGVITSHGAEAVVSGDASGS